MKRFFCILKVSRQHIGDLLHSVRAKGDNMKKITKLITSALLCVSLTLSGCSDNGNKNSIPRRDKFTLTKSTNAGNSGDVKLQPGDTYAVISVRDFGDIKVKLYPDLVPYEVYNFVELAKRGDYNGRVFHRLVDDFMIQGGSTDGSGGKGDSFDGGQFQTNINTSLRHYYGVFCYADSGAGEIADGFYIVNNKKPQNDLDTIYDYLYQSKLSEAMSYINYLNSIDSSNPNYNMLQKVAVYDNNAAVSAQAMKETLTDAVRTSYAERGGVPSIDGSYTVFGRKNCQ